VPHCLIKWFFSYLNHRSQCVRIGTDYSRWMHLNGAMPQGSWLGPLSFLVLIDHLDSLIHKYVDDTTLTEPLCVQHQLSNIELYFQQLQVWANNNDVVVNFNQTKEIVMGPPSKTSHLARLHFSSGHFERANSVKLLGINLDADFSLKLHVEAITSKATQRLLFSKATQAYGCPPRPVASFLHIGNQACTGVCGPSLESLAHENTN